MSIWSTFVWIEPVAEAGYGRGDGELGGFVECASAVSWYGGDGVRLSVCEPRQRSMASCGPDTADCVLTAPLDAECVLNRSQVIALRDALTEFLARTERDSAT